LNIISIKPLSSLISYINVLTLKQRQTKKMDRRCTKRFIKEIKRTVNITVDKAEWRRRTRVAGTRYLCRHVNFLMCVLFCVYQALI